MVSPHQEPSGPDSELVEATLGVVRRQLRYQLDEEQQAAVRESIERHQRLAEKLRAHPLRNADEPDFVFQAYQAEGQV